jgi:hypothetical protein
MTTRDVEIGYGTGWIAVVPTGTVMYVYNVTGHVLYYRFGIDGTSTGLPLDSKKYIKTNETVYIKDNTHFITKITVVGD